MMSEHPKIIPKQKSLNTSLSKLSMTKIFSSNLLTNLTPPNITHLSLINNVNNTSITRFKLEHIYQVR